MDTQVPGRARWWHRLHPHTGRGISLTASLFSALGLFWFLYARADWNPAVGQPVEFFWVRVLLAFFANAILQEWTLATETGRGDELVATLDKFTALVPFIVVLALEVYWIGKESIIYLSWRHHFVGALWAAYSLVDFSSTDITNQRLRALQFAPPRNS